MRVQGWDPVLIISQIICLQTIHYLSLSLLVPPLLTIASSATLTYSGGPSTVAHILDWRELAARPTVSSASFLGLGAAGAGGGAAAGWRKLRGAWAGGKKVGDVAEAEGIGAGVKAQTDADEDGELWDFGVDDRRGWLLGAAWIAATAVDILPLYHLVRRPTHILDFSLTLNLVHLIFTTYYAGAFPTALFYWVVQALGALLMIVVGEQLCVRREMRTELTVTYDAVEGDVIELSDVGVR
ncbi:hypothetical protein Q5752_000367 [Cryptotrichosporon argae]